MSLLNLSTTNATSEVKEIFDEIQSIFGMVPNGLRLLSVNPERLKGKWSAIKNSMLQDKEIQKLYTIMRYLISEEVDCEYCVGVNGGRLINMYGMTQDDLQKMSKEPSTAPLDEKNKALLLFSLKSLNNPETINKDDIDTLRGLAITEKEIFDIVDEASQMRVIDVLFKTFKVEND